MEGTKLGGWDMELLPLLARPLLWPCGMVWVPLWLLLVALPTLNSALWFAGLPLPLTQPLTPLDTHLKNNHFKALKSNH